MMLNMRPMWHPRWAAYFVAIHKLLLVTALADPVQHGAIEDYPKASIIVDGSMVQFGLRFEAPVDHERSTLVVKGSLGEHRLQPRFDSAPTYLFAIEGHLEPGVYELVWVAQFVGGHARCGTIPFSVSAEMNH